MKLLLLLPASLAVLLYTQISAFATHPLAKEGCRWWLIAGLVYLMCSLGILLEAPVRKLILRRVSLTRDAEIARVVSRLG